MGDILLKKKPRDESKREVLIFGEVLDLNDNKEIKDVKITLACTSITTNNKGEFEFTVRNNDLKTNYLEVVALGYKTVETGFFSISPKISLEINFYLEEDDKPFINCAEK